jgi:hypothetical protein
MTTFINFTPSSTQAPSFTVTLDDVQYNVIVTSSFFRNGQGGNGGYYINVYALDGTLVICRALVGSPVGKQLQSLAWASGKATATTVDPHGYRLGGIVTLSLTGSSPDGYNGTFQCLVTGPSTFTYALSSDPGMATAFGLASYDISLVAGLFDSTLVYRTQNGQFEVNP